MVLYSSYDSEKQTNLSKIGNDYNKCSSMFTKKKLAIFVLHYCYNKTAL